VTDGTSGWSIGHISSRTMFLPGDEPLELRHAEQRECDERDGDVVRPPERAIA
jgi:hypothetical protein